MIRNQNLILRASGGNTKPDSFLRPFSDPAGRKSVGPYSPVLLSQGFGRGKQTKKKNEKCFEHVVPNIQNALSTPMFPQKFGGFGPCKLGDRQEIAP